jgi:hypothetical protein
MGYLFDQINTLLQVHAKIDESPLNAFTLIFFLFEDEHVVIEELLEFLIGKVNTQLLESVVLRIVLGNGGYNTRILYYK